MLCHPNILILPPPLGCRPPHVYRTWDISIFRTPLPFSGLLDVTWRGRPRLFLLPHHCTPNVPRLLSSSRLASHHPTLHRPSRFPIMPSYHSSPAHFTFLIGPLSSSVIAHAVPSRRPLSITPPSHVRPCFSTLSCHHQISFFPFQTPLNTLRHNNPVLPPL
jgi:hypothetical protein